MRLSECDQEERQRAAEFMDYAALLIERHGWLQYKSGTFETGFCVMGGLTKAIRQACSTAFGSSPVIGCAFSASALSRAGGLDGSTIADFRRRLAQNMAEWLIAEGELAPSSSEEGAEAFAIVGWNDEPGRRASDVINALRKAALTLREQA